MIENFKEWMIEIQDEAINEKCRKAKEKGDETKWENEIWKSPEKNKVIKNRFRDEGFKLGYKSRPSYVSGAGEWLYDFVWREFNDDGNLLNIVLAMEIEVSDMEEKAIKYDFNKLLQADSQYKVLVFQLKTESEVNAALENFTNAAKVYNSKSNSEYLLCGWCTSKNKFLFSDFRV
jgi:hypothetical protein